MAGDGLLSRIEEIEQEAGKVSAPSRPESLSRPEGDAAEPGGSGLLQRIEAIESGAESPAPETSEGSARARANLMLDRSPEDATRALRLSRETGAPVAATARNPGIMERGLAVQGIAEVSQSAPQLHAVLAGDPVTARAVSDSLTPLTAWETVVNDMREFGRNVVTDPARRAGFGWIAQHGGMKQRVGEEAVTATPALTERLRPEYERLYAGLTPEQQEEVASRRAYNRAVLDEWRRLEATPERGQALADEGALQAELAQNLREFYAPPEDAPGWQVFLGEATESVVGNTLPIMLLGVGGGAIAGNVGRVLGGGVGLGGMFVQVYGDRYQQLRREGYSATDADLHSTVYALTETLPEMLPVSIALGPGKVGLRNAVQRVLQTAGAEGATEALTEVLQIGYESGVLGEDVGGLGEMVGRVLYAAALGATVGGGMGAIGAAAGLQQDRTVAQELERQLDIQRATATEQLTTAEQREMEVTERERARAAGEVELSQEQIGQLEADRAEADAALAAARERVAAIERRSAEGREAKDTQELVDIALAEARANEREALVEQERVASLIADATRDHIAYAQQQEALDSLIAIAEETPARLRDEELFLSVTDGSGLAYIDAQTLRSALTNPEAVEGMAEPVTLQTFFQLVPEAQAQFDEAARIGGDLVLPLNRVVSAMASNKGLRELVKESTRLTPEAMNTADYEGVLDSTVTPALRATADKTAIREKVSAFKRRIFGDVRRSGYSAKAASMYAETFAAFYRTQMMRLQGSPEALSRLDAMMAGLSVQSAARRDMLASAADGVTLDQLRELEQPAWHGSPHLFDEFRLSAIGTGEGAQVYGWGLYFAESIGVAKSYSTALSKTSNYPLIDGVETTGPEWEEQVRSVVDGGFSRADITQGLKLLNSSGRSIDAAIAEASNEALWAPGVLEFLQALKPKTITWPGKTDHLYKVEIPDEAVARFLDWDASLSEQPVAVQEALERLAAQDRERYGEGGGLDYYIGDPESHSGESIVRYLESMLGRREASAFLLSAGIPGTKYLDAGSRDTGEGTRNLVVFDESLITIKSRNGEPIRKVLEQQAQEQGTLVVQHNLSEANLLHAAKMGGLAAPSIAVTKGESPLENFGEITLIGSRDMADPRRDSATRMFGADIYSPRYPSVAYEIPRSKHAEARAWVKAGEDATGERVQWDEVANKGADELKNAPAVMWEFLSSEGVEPEIVMTPAIPKEQLDALAAAGFEPFFGRSYLDLIRSQEFKDLALPYLVDLYEKADAPDLAERVRQSYAEAVEMVPFTMARDVAGAVQKAGESQKVAPGRTRDSLRTQIADSGLREKFLDYVEDKFSSLEPTEKLFAGFTASGNRRYIPHTIENVIKALKKDLRGGEGVNYGVGSVRAKYTKQFKSISGIKAEEGRLVTKEQFDALKEEVDAEFFSIAEAVVADAGRKDFGAYDAVASAMMDASRMGLPRALSENGLDDVRPETQKRVAGFLMKLRDMPTEYFEGKLLRRVALAEFEGAVVPSDIGERALAALKESGIERIETYERGDKASRAAAVGKFSRSFFQGPADIADTPEFRAWFGESKVVDENGRPLVVHHGTGNLEELHSFNPAMTGKGNDQIGSGFYFTTLQEEASGYATAVTQNAGPGATKLGGDSSPGVMSAFLSIKNPMVVNGSSLRDVDIDITRKQAFEIIKRAPGVKDIDESPVGNWIDVWSAGKITDKMLREVAENYTGASLLSLEGDFFRSDATAFRAALRDVLGYDGVVQDFGDGHKHFVAWFPEQIKSVNNRGTFSRDDPRVLFQEEYAREVASARAALQWTEHETSKGPLYEGLTVSLVPSGEDWGMGDQWRHLRVLDHESGKLVGDLVLAMRNGAPAGLHVLSFEPEHQGRGLGQDVVEMLLANVPGSVDVVDILDESQGFWRRMGAYGYSEDARNARLSWDTYAAARLLPPRRGGERPAFAAGRAVDGGPDLGAQALVEPVSASPVDDRAGGEVLRLTLAAGDGETAAANRRADDPGAWIPREHFEVSAEPGDGQVEVDASTVYDMASDPLELRDDATDEADTTGAHPATVLERLIRDNGFAGYRVGDVVAMFSDAPREAVGAATRDRQLGQRRDGPRGQIRFEGDRSVITVFEQHDFSTVLHEASHFFLEAMLVIAESPDAPAEFVRDYQTTLAWLGNRGEPLTVEQHEKFARGGEAYFLEGKAPSGALRRMFRVFRAWMERIYESAVALQVQLAPEVRGVFDRMLASSEEIDALRDSDVAGADPNFLSLLTPAERRAYLARREEQFEKAKEHLLLKLVRQVRRERKKAWRDEREALRPQVEAEVNAQPVYQATHWLQTGKRLDGQESPLEPVKLDRAELARDYHPEAVARLPRGVTTKSGGAATDVVAEWFGYGSGAEMVAEMSAAPPRRRLIEQRLDEMMRERHGDMLSDGSIQAEAEASLAAADRTGEVLYVLQVLARRAGKPAATREFYEAEVDRMLAGMPVGEVLDSRRYRTAEVRAARKVGRHLARGNLELAAAAKREQLIQHILYRRSLESRDMVDKTRARFARYVRPQARGKTKVDEDYHRMVQRLVATVSMGPRMSDRTLARLTAESLSAWMAQRADADGTVFLDPPNMLDQPTHFKEMSLEDFAAFVDVVDNVYAQGRMLRSVVIEGKRIEMAQVGEAISSSVRENVPEREQPFDTRTPAARRGQLARGFFYSLLKARAIMRRLDGGKLGPMHRFVMRAMDRAEVEKTRRMQQVAEDVDAIFKRHLGKGMRGMSSRMTYIPELRQSMSRSSMIAVLLNLGNADNKTKLMEGRKVRGADETWTQEQVDAVLRHLTKRDLAFANEVWAYIDSYWPEVAALERRTMGVTPAKVEAEPFEVTLANGETVQMRGGYYPLMYDSNVSPRAQDVAQESIADIMKRGRFASAQTQQGHTQARVSGVREPVRLDLGVLVQHLEQVVTDLTMREATVNAYRILNRRDVADAIAQTLGVEAHQMLSIWAQDVAVGSVVAGGSIESILDGWRAGVSVATMGFKFSTMMAQITGFTHSVVRIGSMDMLRGLRAVMTGFGSAGYSSDRGLTVNANVRAVYEKSEFMRQRATTFHRDVRDAMRAMEKKGEVRGAIAKAGFWPIVKMQAVVDVVSWLGAYHRGLSLYPDNEAAAVEHADRMIIEAQGSGYMKDLSGIERGSIGPQSRLRPAWRLWTTFYSYFNTKLNLAYSRAAETDFRKPRDVARLAVDYMLLFILEAVLAEVILGRAPDPDDEDDDGWLLWSAKLAASSTLATIPVVSQISGSLQGFDAAPAGLRGLDTIARGVKETGEAVSALAMDDEELDVYQLVRAINGAGGVIFKYPAAQTNQVLRAMEQAREGEDVTLWDFLVYQER